MTKNHRISIFNLTLLFAFICEVICSCKWNDFYGKPGHTMIPDMKVQCHEDMIDSLSDHHAICDTYIDLDMRECYKENWLGILVGGYYVYNVDIKVENARSANLFARDLNTYNGLRVKSLEISGQLTEIPAEIYALKYLEYIDLSHNHIKNLQTSFFAILPKLFYLDLSYNDIIDMSSLSLSNQNKLAIWKLNNNRLRAFSVTSLYNYQKLERLDLSHNEIESLYLTDFEGDLNLKVLDLSYNKLTAIDGYAFRKLNHELWYLDVSHNRITNMNSNNLITYPKLSELVASYNQIDTLDDFRKIPGLYELKLDHNKITSITRKMFENNYDLYEIHLNDNPIEIIESNSFNNNVALYDIILRNTRLTSIQRNTFNGYTRKGGTMDLSQCMISEITDDTFTGVTGLNNLNVSSNAIQNISNIAFYNLISLKILDLSHNQLIAIEFNTNNLQNLREFYAHHNKIEKISQSMFGKLIALTDLDLSFNNIKEMDPMALANMKQLINFNFSSNKDFDVMINLPISDLEYLEQMQMVNTGNTIFKNGSMTHCHGYYRRKLNSAFGKVKEIEYNAFGNCPFLRYFNLSHNELESFHVNTTSIEYIKELNLANNHIREINSDTFNDLHNLETLNLANNDIVHVDSDAFKDVPYLKYFYISSTVTPRKPLRLTGLKQHFEILSIGNFNLDMKFDDSQYYYIKTLELKSCGIQDLSTIHFSNIHELKQLDVSGNDIAIVNHETLKDLSTLVSLNLRENNITFVLAGSFLNMNRLRNLDLSDNKISTMFYGVLDGPEKFDHLNLSSNSLKNLNVKVLPPTSYLYLDNNPLTSINLNDVYNSNLYKISLGYTLSCEYFVDAKKNSPENFKKFVTADPRDFYIQNINGVPCQ